MAAQSPRSSVALFMATAGMVAAQAGFSAQSSLADNAFSSSQLLAQATEECVPIGEGENCARPRKRKRTNLIQQENDSGSTPSSPAADPSKPTPNPGAQSGSASEELNEIERGDL